MMRSILRPLFMGIFVAGACCTGSISNNLLAQDVARPNVLFIAVDDLNHWVGHLKRNPQTKTPNIDRLAARGTTFSNAHCAAPVCNPSRTALLSGMRPSSTGVYDNGQPFALAVKESDSVVSQFKKAGYETLGMGKLWHGGLGFEEQWTSTRAEGKSANGKAKAKANANGKGKAKEKVQAQNKSSESDDAGNTTTGKVDDRSIGGIQFGIVQGGDEAVSDTAIADFGIEELSKDHTSPFFLTLGFHKPHMPWNVPQKYYDMHPLDSIQLPPIQEDDLSDIPDAGKKMARSSGDHARVLESGRWKEAVQAYLAAISYLDGQVGRVLDALDKSKYKDNTIICFWGDHGWHLGEKEHWRKFALWEEATRAPFIWVVPGTTKAGTECKTPVDFMSIYPTLCELSKVPVPNHVEGKSISALLKDVKHQWSGAAVTTHGFKNHAVRTDRWRYIRYADGSEELYDHSNDPYEWKNLANDGKHADTKKELAEYLPKKDAEPSPKK